MEAIVFDGRVWVRGVSRETLADIVESKWAKDVGGDRRQLPSGVIERVDATIQGELARDDPRYMYHLLKSLYA